MTAGNLALTIAIKADTSGLQAGLSRAGQALTAIGQAGAQAGAAASSAAKVQAEAQSAAGRAAGEAAGRTVNALKVVGEAHAQAGQAAEVSAGQMAMGRRIVTANLINVANVAVATKGDLAMMLSPVPDIIYGLKEMGLGFSGAMASAAAAGAAVLAFAAPLAIGAARAAEYTTHLKALEVGLRAIGRAGEFSVQQMQATAYDLARGPGDVGRGDALGAVRGLAASRMINTDNLKAAAGVARDLATALGVDVPQAASALANALDGGEADIRKLNETMRFATAADLEHIHALYQHGRGAAAVTEVIGLLRRQIGGLAEQEMGAFAKAWRDAKNAMSDFADAASRPFRAATLDERIKEATRDLQMARQNAAADPNAGIDLGLLERRLKALQGSPGDAAASNADMMGGDAATERSADAYEQMKRRLVERARILGTAARARRQAEAEYTARQDAVAAGMTGGYVDQAAKQAGRHAFDEGNAALALAAERTRVLAEAQNLLAAAAGKGALAEQEAARQAAAMVAVYDQTGLKGAEAAEATRGYADALAGIDAGRLAGERQAFVLQIDREVAANDNLAEAYRGGNVEAIRRAALDKDATDLSLRLGWAKAKVTAELEREQRAMAGPALAKYLADLERQLALEERIAAAAAAGDRDGVRRATVEGKVDDFRRANPYAKPTEIDAERTQRTRQYDSGVREEARQTTLAYDATARYRDEMAKLEEQRATGALSAEAYGRRYREIEDDKLRASRDWADGASRAVRQWQWEATDAAAAAERGVNGMLKAGEDGFVKWAMTGKASAADLFSSLAEEALRAAYRMAVIAPLFGGESGGLFGGLLAGAGAWLGGQFGSSGAATIGVGDGLGFGNLFPTAHTGGIAGVDPLSKRWAPAALFAGAPRFHDGGLAGDEMPIIVRRTEGIFTPRQMDNADRLLGAAMARQPVNVVINVNNRSDAVKTRTEQRRDAGGDLSIDVIVEDLEARMGRRLRHGDGPLAEAFEGRYGMTARGGY